ncbi:MAG TPA: thioredoxin family protein [Thiobacillaceae bacterium]|nr:thioredoxin family protein [Thiobacillaceae bacterium]
MRWLLLLLSFCILSAHAEVRNPETHFFMPKLDDFQEELAVARQEGKTGILIMFEMDECPFCHRMKNTVLNQSQVQDWYRRHFLTYALDVKGDTAMVDFQGKHTTEKAFALEHRARATPTFVFFDLDGKVMTRFTGAARSPDEFLLLGRYVVDGVYRGMPFNVFKRQQAGP